MSDFKEFRKYVFPNMLSMLGSSCYVLVDTLFITRIGDYALAALNICLPIYSICIGLGSFLAVGASTHYSILKAQNKEKEGSKYFTFAVLTALVTSVLIALIVMLNKRSVAYLLGANEETIEMCVQYFNAYVTLSPFITLQYIVLSFIRNDGDPKLAGYAALAGSLFNLFSDYFFIFTLNLGMFGAALATGLAPVVSLLIASTYFFRKKNQFHLVRDSFTLEVMKNITSLGFPTLINSFSSSVTMLAFNKQLLAIGGNMAVTAYGIIVNISVVIQYIMSGVAEGTQPLFSSNYGSGEHSRIRTFYRFAIVTSLLIATTGMAVDLLFGSAIISIFNGSGSAELLAITKNGMFIYFIGLFAHGITTLLMIYFTSVDHPMPSNVLSILKAGVIITPMVLILPKFLGLNGVWISYPASEFLIAAVGLYFAQKSPYLKKISCQ